MPEVRHGQGWKKVQAPRKTQERQEEAPQHAEKKEESG
jgi:hypothetical protein